MNFENLISLNFPAIILETLKCFKSFMKLFIFPKFHETLQLYSLVPDTIPRVPYLLNVP